jgi:Tfp pilus assembly protein FimV
MMTMMQGERWRDRAVLVAAVGSAVAQVEPGRSRQRVRHPGRDPQGGETQRFFPKENLNAAASVHRFGLR